MVKLNDTCKNELCEMLKNYANGEEYTYLSQNAGYVKSLVNPHYHNSRKIIDGQFQEIRRIRFLICSENSWNRINISEELRDYIISGCKAILDKYNICYREVMLNSYYPYMESRMQYASWNVCLDIYCEE